MSKIGNYLKETKGEMKHVSWPSAKQAFYFTGIIIVIAILISAFLGLFDFVFTWMLDTFVI
jgi:preprotein translocase subunit SecE